MAGAGNGKDNPQEVGSGKSSGMKWVIIGVLALVLLGGGGFFGWRMFLSTGRSDAPAAAKEAPQITHQMDSFLVNLADPGGKRYLKVNIQVLLDNPLVEDEIKTRTYAVRDTILMLLSAKAYDDIATPNGKDILKREMMVKLNRLLTKGQVKEVFFTDFLVQ